MELFAVYERNTLPEVYYYGAAAIVHGEKTLLAKSPELEVYWRSLAKPWQSRVFAEENKDLTLKQKAVISGSHHAERGHLRQIKQVIGEYNLKLINTPPTQLKTPRKCGNTSPLFHNCSGKHAGIVRGCLMRGWSVEKQNIDPLFGREKSAYHDPKHPYNVQLLKIMHEDLGSGWQPRLTAVDGCGLPTFSSTLPEIAKAFAAMTRNRQRDWIWQAMTNEPWFVGGTRSIDTRIMQQFPGTVLAKIGADGLIALGIVSPKYPDGLGVVIKLTQAGNWKALEMICADILHQALGSPKMKTHKIGAQQLVLKSSFDF